MLRYHMSLILQSFFFDQAGCQYPANGRIVLQTFSLIQIFSVHIEYIVKKSPVGYFYHQRTLSPGTKNYGLVDKLAHELHL